MIKYISCFKQQVELHLFLKWHHLQSATCARTPSWIVLHSYSHLCLTHQNAPTALTWWKEHTQCCDDLDKWT